MYFRRRSFLGISGSPLSAQAQSNTSANSTIGELVNNTLNNAARPGTGGDMLQNVISAAVTDQVVNSVQDVLDNVSGPEEIEAAAAQISAILDITEGDAAGLVQDALNGDLIGGSLQTALNDMLTETVAAGIDELLGGAASGDLMNIISGLLNGLNGATVNPTALLGALNALGISLDSLGLSEEHLNALLGLSVPLCPTAANVNVPFPEGCLTSAWAPAIDEICNANWGILDQQSASSSQRSGDRLTCTNAPDGTAAMAFTEVAGKAPSLMDFRQQVPGLAADAARMVTRVFIPEDYDFHSNGRMAMGLRVGDPANPGNRMGGGVSPEDQNASSVRVNFRMDGDSIKPALYGYYLDRTNSTTEGNSVWGGGGETETKQWGQNTWTDNALPKGQWVTMVLDVVLNDVGQANGSSTLTVLNDAGETIASAAQTGVVFRNDPSWKIIGPYMTEKLNDHDTHPRTQSIYYSDYSISAATGTGDECTTADAGATEATGDAAPVTTTSGPT